MKRIALLAAAALVAGCADASQPLAPTSAAVDEIGPGTPSFHEVDAGGAANGAAANGADVNYFELHFTTDARPFVECVGETVQLYGSTVHHQRNVVRPDGSVLIVARGVGGELTMTGMETGRTWSHSTAENEIFIFHFDPDGSGFATHSSMLRYLADGDYPDLYLRHRYHLEFDEMGQVTGGTTTPDEFMCQETGQG